MSDMNDQGAELLLRYQKSLDCVHCGLCLATCPTYVQTGNEAASPRGRIYLMRGLAEGHLEPTPGFRDQMELCLMCRACETVCPSGVEFGRMMEITRGELHRRDPGGWATRLARRALLDGVIPKRRRLHALASATGLARRVGLFGLLRATRVDRLLPATLRSMVATVPDVPPARERRPLPAVTPPRAGVPRRGKVAVLAGCVMPELFPDVNRRTVAVLADFGYEVVVPPAQGCCGALHAHAGDLDRARELARANVSAFLDADVDAVILNSAGCGAAMREYGHWLDDERSRELAEKVVDVLVFFAREGLEPRGDPAWNGKRVTYDAPCHLHHAQRAVTAPLDVLRRVPGIELVPLPGADTCCGAAGIYNLTHPDMSAAVLTTKLDQLAATGAELLLTGNPGCMLQWRKGIADRGLAIEVRHPVDLL